MSAFNQLPQVYKIAVLLGARVEVFFKKENKWFNLFVVSGLTHKAKYRVVSPDESILQKAKELLDTMYTKVKYNDYDYLVPNNALVAGQIIIMEYGLGCYVEVQEDLSLKDLKSEYAQKLLEEKQQRAYFGQDYEYAHGLNDEH